ADASAQGSGGQITITAGRLAATPQAIDLILTANAAGTGNGGQVSVTTTGGSSASNLVVGFATGDVSIEARGGSANSLAGDGGTVTISSGRDLIVDNNSLSIGPQGLSGKGATITLTNGTVLPGTMLIGGELSADGKGNGSGGSITLNVNSNDEF